MVEGWKESKHISVNLWVDISNKGRMREQVNHRIGDAIRTVGALSVCGKGGICLGKEKLACMRG